MIGVLQFMNALDPVTGEITTFKPDILRIVSAMAANLKVEVRPRSENLRISYEDSVGTVASSDATSSSVDRSVTSNFDGAPALSVVAAICTRSIPAPAIENESSPYASIAIWFAPQGGVKRIV